MSSIKNIEGPDNLKTFTPRASSSTKFITRGSKTRSRLPENFHKTVIELENNFTYDKNIETIQELLHLYKVNFN
jgi:hypothetical protein